MALLATAKRLESIHSIEDVRKWTGLAPDMWKAVNAALGNVPNLRLLALLPKGAFQKVVDTTIVTLPDAPGRSRLLTPVEAAQANVMRSLARQKLGLPEEDLLEFPDTEEEHASPRPKTTVPTEFWRPSKPKVPGANVDREVTEERRFAPGSRRLDKNSVSALPSAPAAAMSAVQEISVAARAEDKPDVQQNQLVARMQVIRRESFYNIHRSQGLLLGPRFRAVNMAAACPGHCYVSLVPWSGPPCLPNSSASSVRSAREKTSRKNCTNHVQPPAQKRSPHPCSGYSTDGFLREMHEPIRGLPDQIYEPRKRHIANLAVSKELLASGGLVLPTRSGKLPGMMHPSLVGDDEDTTDEPCMYSPELYDAMLNCTFLEGSPAPGASVTQLPQAVSIAECCLAPFTWSSQGHFGRARLSDAEMVSHSFEILRHDGGALMRIDGYKAKVSRRTMSPSKSQAASSANSFHSKAQHVADTRGAQLPSVMPEVTVRAEVRRHVARWSKHDLGMQISNQQPQ